MLRLIAAAATLIRNLDGRRAPTLVADGLVLAFALVLYVATLAPTDITMDNLSVDEELPAGTLIGRFTTDDPDEEDDDEDYVIGIAGDPDAYVETDSAYAEQPHEQSIDII